MLLSSAFFLLAGCNPDVADVRPTWDGQRVIVLVLDGVRDEESFGDGTSPVTGGEPETLMPQTWETLVPQGRRATGVLNAGLTLTGPAHATLLSGTRQALANYEVIDHVGLYRPELPTVFEQARQKLGLAESQLQLLGNVSLIQPMAHSRSPMGGAAKRAFFRLVGDEPTDETPERGGQDDRVVFAVLQTLLERRSPVLTVANLHQVDRATHGAGHDTYEDHLAVLDQELPVFWEWLQAQPDFTDNTWLFVVSDHGRHDAAATNPSWQSHGDSCTGCRGVPWLVLGPGVTPGDVDETLLLEDVAPTIAALLGFELPWAQGLVATSLVGEPAHTPRSGLAQVDADGPDVIEVRFTDDPDHRTEVVLDGWVLSDPDALLAGGAAVAADGSRTWTCHRSLVADPVDGRIPWQAWCGVRPTPQEAVLSLELPATEVAPYWEPVLVPDGDGGLYVLSLHNPEGSAVPGQDADEGVRVLHSAQGVWTEHEMRLLTSFPTGLAAVPVDGHLAMVFAAGDPGRDSRHTRRLHGAALDPETGTWTPPAELGLSVEHASDYRLERPALDLGEDGVLRLAAIGHSEGETHLVRAWSDDGGSTWTQLSAIEHLGRVLPHVTPTVDGERTWFATWDSRMNTTLACVVGGEGAAICSDTGSPRLADLDRTDAGTEVVIDAGTGQWERVTLAR